MRDNSSAKARQQFNRWKKLRYHDPVDILLRLRALEIELTDVQMDERARRLRVASLKQFRELARRRTVPIRFGVGLWEKDLLRDP